MSRTERKTIAWVCLSALLFLQFTVAAHACPTRVDGDTPTSAGAAAAGRPCQGMDQERPKLCEQHCIQASQSVDTQPHSALSAPVLPLIAVIVPAKSFLPARARFCDAWLATVVDPPPLVRFGVLRI
jgi:hypothetical protein